MDLQPATILQERYQIIEKLGQGGMGAVFLAWDQTLETRVAVKSNFNPAPESVDQFLKEARLLAGLRHPNLPRVTDYFVIGKEQFLVMDYIPGDDLGKRLKLEGPQPLDDVLSWSRQLCAALAYMHSQDPPVTHRDIKPANIKLTPEGKVILVDFGIAKVDSAQAQTATGASGYTPGYAPPEQYGRGHTGPYSDQFSLAATIYALLTQAKPADSIQRVLGKAALMPIQQMDPSIPQNIADALLKAMALQPDERFESVSAFLEALEDPDYRLDEVTRNEMTSVMIPRGVGPTGEPVSPVDRTIAGAEVRKQRKPNLLLVGGFAILALLLLGAAALLLFVFPESPIYVLSQADPTATGTAAPLSSPTLQNTQAEVQIVAVATATAFPSPTPTEEPTPTLAPEKVGASGVIAFASDRGEDGIVQIWTMRVLRDLAGEVYTDEFTQLTFDEGDKDQPVWSPDGSQIAYVAPGGESNGLDIWVMDVDGGSPTNITMTAGDEFDPVWMPDGSLIAFTHHLRDAGGMPIYALTWVAPDGTGRERLSEDFIEWDPTFSPDGQYMLYTIHASSHDYFYFRSAGDSFVAPKGFDLRGLFGEFGQVSDPAWAPLGDQFAYTEHKSSRELIVLVTYQSMQANGLHQPTEYVLTDTGADTDPAWSPDARWLAFTSLRDGDSEVYLMTTTGRPQINLSQSSGVDRSPDWLPIP
ncbi:MAG: protein kinase [Chloroflexota bacterium]|nr:protein kinase [Chloroflexota bacterium]